MKTDSRTLHIRGRRARTCCVRSWMMRALALGPMVVNHFASLSFPCRENKSMYLIMLEQRANLYNARFQFSSSIRCEVAKVNGPPSSDPRKGTDEKTRSYDR